ncbi:MAG: SRPBCC family protein [Bacteroidetes bacterium]|nr:MAG: SRPBCC family protein [Bacteroidota bacterium]
MRLIRFALLSIIILFLVVTAISLFIPSHIQISRIVSIKAEKDPVIGYIKDPAKWKEWYPGLDTTKLYYENGIAKGVILNNRDSAHPVYLHITKQTDGEVVAEMVPRRMRPVTNGWKLVSYPTNDSLALQWYMDFHLRWYPWEKFSSLLFEGSNGPRMQQGLNNLKNLVEHR